MEQRVRVFWMALLAVALLAACTVKPVDTRPFSDKTAELVSEVRLEAATLANFRKTLSRDLDKGKARAGDLKLTWQLESMGKELDAFLQSMQNYADALASLQRKGSSGAEATRTIIDKVGAMAAVFGGSVVLPAGAVKILKGVNQYLVASKAQKSLAAAVRMAQKPVEDIMQISTHLVTNMERLTRLLARRARIRASQQAGQTLIGFYNNARITREHLYLKLNRETRLPAGKVSGYCIKDKRLDEHCLERMRSLKWLDMLDRRIRAVETVVLRYRDRVAAIGKWEALRIRRQRAIGKAFISWARAHADIVKSLEQGGTTRMRELNHTLRVIRNGIRE